MAEPSPEVAKAPLFTLEVPAAGLQWSPRTVDEVREWLAEERKEWEWLRTIKAADSVTNSFTSIQFHAEQDINTFLSLLANEPNRLAELIPQIHARLSHRFNNERAIYSKSPLAKYVQAIAAKDPKIAAHTAYILIGRDAEPSRNGYMASALAAHYLLGPQSIPDAAATAWKEIVRELNEGRTKLRTEAGVAADEWRARSADITNLHNHQRGAFDTDQEARAGDFKTQQENHEQRMKQIEGSFKAGLTMSSAVQYFEKKSDHHGTKATAFAWCAGIAGALIAVAVVYSATVLGDDPKPARIGVALALAFLALWLLRVLVRLFFSNSHLSTDMKTRATLVQTYLALIQEGGGIADKDRARIVDLVFRPASDGLVKEDGAPPTLFSMFQRNASGS